MEATGIARERVELMEAQLKEDVIQDMKKYGGRILLHEECSEGSSFTIVVFFYDYFECFLLKN